MKYYDDIDYHKENCFDTMLFLEIKHSFMVTVMAWIRVMLLLA